MSAARRCVLFGLAATLCACSSTEKPVELNLQPTDAKSEILLEIPKVVGDPTNIRGAFLSAPVFNPNGPIKHYYSCVRFNPRDPNTRHYLGSRDYIAHFFQGHLNQFVEATRDECGNALYQPFPELEKLCYGFKCQ